MKSAEMQLPHVLIVLEHGRRCSSVQFGAEVQLIKLSTYEAKALLFLTSFRLMTLTFLLFKRLDLKSSEKDDEP